MIYFPNAKVNLGLNIVSKRSDGYHNIETIFYPIGLKDALEVIPSDKTRAYRFFQTGINIGGNAENNLVIKALSLLREQKHIPAIDIHLLKTIPCGAGLGGGSSNATFMLQLLNDVFSLEFSDEELKQFAVKLGADCAFFLKNKPAFATGIGDQLEEIDLSLQNYYFVLVKPDIFVSTHEAYKQIQIQNPEISLKEIVQKPMETWRELMHNDFEISIFKQHPEIEKIKQTLYDNGAVYSSMSGSGTAVYAFFEKLPQASFSELFSNHFVWKNYL